jgi:ABC-type transport system involved in multi-copper enzyme maturation permease subunit
MPLGFQLYILEDTIIGGLGAWVAILISVIITAFFIPNMLRKGTVDLLLVKPVHRWSLLLYKFVGGLTFIFLNTSVAVGGVWLALGLRSGIWAPSFLLCIFVITGFFAILYSISTLFAVLTRSPIVAILLTCGIWFLLWLVGLFYGIGEGVKQEEKRLAARQAEKEANKDKEPPKKEEAKDDEPGGRRRGRRGEPEDPDQLPFRSDNWFFKTVNMIHFVTPRTSDLNHLMSRILIRDLLTANQVKQQKLDDTGFSWGESLTVSGLFVVVLLGLSCWRFATKDY